MNAPILNNILQGLCYCGCGQKTKVCKIDRKERGLKAGDYYKYIHGHNRTAKGKAVKYIIDSNGCWIWQSAITTDGYGLFGLRGKLIYAHRYFYEQKYGSIPFDKVIDHICNVRKCVNPEHLRLLDRHKNMMRGKFGDKFLVDGKYE